MPTLRSFVVVLVALTAVAPLRAQSIVAGTVRGMVKDSTGRPLGDVRVALTDRTSGFTHVQRTPRAGTFGFSFLPPGEYDLLAERLGFLPVEVRGVGVGPAAEAELVVTLLPVEPPVMERDVTMFGDRLDRAGAGPGWSLDLFELRRLPDDRRGLSAQGRYSTIANEQLAIEGLPADYAQTSVDGIPFRFPTHPVLGSPWPGGATFPVSAFNGAAVDPVGVDVEWSGFTSGRLAALGARGSQRLETRLYADWSPVSFRSSKYFDPKAVSGNSFRGGMVLSGPVIRDTAHFVLGVDAQRLQTPFPAAWEPSDADSSLLAAADSLGVDLRPYGAPRLATVRLASGFGRFDWQANQRNRLVFLGFGSLLESDDAPLGMGRTVGLGTNQKSWNLGLGATLTNTLSPSFALELRAGFEIGRQEDFGNDTALTHVAGLPAAWGADPALPGTFKRSGVRLSETVHITAGSHRLKLGGGGRFVSVEDIYAWGRLGSFAFGSPDDLVALDGGFVQSVGREPIAKYKTYEFGWFLQDRWTVAPGADFAIGVRMDWERVDRKALTPNTQLFARSGILSDAIDATRIKVSPRVGLSWDVGNAHTWVVRAEGGAYHGVVAGDAFGEAVAEGGGRQLRVGTGVLGRWPVPPDSVVAAPRGSLVALLPMDFSAPRSTRAALGVSGALGNGVTLHLAGSYRHTQFLVKRRDLNRVPGSSGRDQYGRPIYGELEQHGAILLAEPGSGRRLDDFSMVSALNQDGVSDYIGVTARLERRVGRSLTLSAGYTYSQTRDNVPGLGDGWDAQLSPFPDSLNGVEWEDGVSDYDVPNRLVFGAELAFRAFRLAGFYRFESGLPFTPGFRDGVDANADGSWRNDPAWVDDQVAGVPDLFATWDCLRTQVGGFAERNSCRGPTRQTLDLRLVLGPFRLGYPMELVVDAMNLLDAEIAHVDRALYLVDPAGTLSTDPATGVVAVPLVANPNFGDAVRRYGSGRYLRIGVRVNYE